MKNIIITCLISIAATFSSSAQLTKFEKDSFPTTSGKQITIYFIGHGSLMFNYNGINVYIDPSMLFADYAKLPKADIILITHHHSDHMDTAAISRIHKNGTQILLPESCLGLLKDIKLGIVLKNGQHSNLYGIEIEAIPAYNTTPGNEKYHPKGRDNGYIITFDGKRVYVAGDTENTPEMAALKDIDIAFLPMNQPYTMTPEQVADAVNAFNPKIFYPYHYGDSDIEKMKTLLSKNKKVEVRIRALK